MKLGKNIHATLSSIHAAESLAKYPFWVASLTKSGAGSKMDAPGQFNVARNEADAAAILARLEGLNPGRKFVILPNV